MMMQMFHLKMGRLGGPSNGSRSDVKNLQIFANQKKQKVLGDLDHPETQSSSPAATPSTTTLAIANKPEAVESVKTEEPPVETDSQPTEVPKSQKNEDLFDLGSMRPNPPKPNNTIGLRTMPNLLKRHLHRRSPRKINLKGMPLPKLLSQLGKPRLRPRPKGSPAPKHFAPLKRPMGLPKVVRRPSHPKPGGGTFHYKNGKIHRNDRSSCWLVFINKSDRCDKKVLFKGDEVSSFRKALAMIEAGK